MANFNLETNRNTAITKIPRLTFQLPQSPSGATVSTTIPIFFCQIGCQLEFEFKNITTAQLKNDREYFTITPTGESNNYINWNGSGASGQDMIRFDLKEIKFSAPARDVVGSITYNKSIQFFFTFVNSTYPNIMIVITVIGKTNNVGSAQTDGFVLLNELAKQIPIPNEVKTVSNLSNVNLGFLLPSNKSFFSTLISENTIQYISMTKIIDIPDKFLESIISRVLGSPDKYQTIVNNYAQNTPLNPIGTIIFFTENIKPISSDQAYVCNANCDRVVGDASMLQPTFGQSTTTKTPTSGSTPTVSGALGGKPLQEECEEEYIFPGTRTNVRIKSASAPTTSTDTSHVSELKRNDVLQSILITIFVIVIIVCSILIIIALYKATNISGFRSLFSRELWNLPNAGWITIGLLGLCSIIIFLAIFLDINSKQNSIKNIEDSKRTEKEKKIANQKPYIFLIIGLSIFIVCACILAYKARKNSQSSNSFSSSSSNNSFQRVTMLPQFGLDPVKFPGISQFNSKMGSLISNYEKSPDTYFKGPGSKGALDFSDLSKNYNQLPSSTKSLLEKQNPSIGQYFKQSGDFAKNIISKNSLPKSLIDSMIGNTKKYQLAQTTGLTPEIINFIKEYNGMVKNATITPLIPTLVPGTPIPPWVRDILQRK
jgi:NADH:ubiquinone oxidoreductase subunit 6 (subunit J)